MGDLTVRYSVVERSPDGLMKTPSVYQGYGCTSEPWNPYDSKEDALSWISENGEDHARYVILKEYTKV